MAGRTRGVGHVEALEAPAEVKARLAAVLATLAGERTVAEAARELAITPTRFHALRRQALEGAAAALAPRPPGRPGAGAEDAERTRLEAEVKALGEELELARLRAEIALALPRVVRPPVAEEKGGPRGKHGGRRSTWFA